MRKFLNLILNEYVKIFSKISTIIMLAAIVLIALAYNGLMMVASNSMNYIPEYGESNINELIEQEKAEKAPGWEIRVERYEFMKKESIPADDGKWKSTAAMEAYAVKEEAVNLSDEKEKKAAQKLFDDYIAAIKSGDWKEYAQVNISKIKADTSLEQEEKDISLWTWQYRLNHDVEPDANWGTRDWRNASLMQLEGYKNSLYSQLNSPRNQQDQSVINETTNLILIQTYRLEHNIKTYTQPATSIEASYMGDEEAFGYWSAFGNSTSLIMIIGVLMIIISGSAISSEFSAGTIKFLLINPVKRWKIFIAKYISVLSVAVVMLLLFYIFNALLAGVFFGFGDTGAPYLHVSGGVVQMGSSFFFVAWKYLLSGSLILLTMTTFAFAISSLVRNSALSIGLGVFLMLSGAGATQLLGEMFGLSWGRYILFADTNLNAIIGGTTPFWGLTVPFALVVVAVYMVVFLLTAWDGFMRRDVK